MAQECLFVQMRSSTSPVESIVGKILLNRMWSTDWRRSRDGLRFRYAQSQFSPIGIGLRAYIRFTFRRLSNSSRRNLGSLSPSGRSRAGLWDFWHSTHVTILLSV